jgi:hypothetical protein
MRRRLSIDEDYSVERPDFPSHISLDWQRWPDPFRVPIYPNSENVQDRWEQIIESKQYPCSDLKRITTFTTSASLDEVEQHYRTIMPLEGWGMITQVAGVVMQFGYSRGWPENNTYSSVTLNLQPDPNDKELTRVELKASGSEVIEYCLAHGGNLGP